MVKSYDEKCFELAQLFLADEPGLDTPERRQQLAFEIQECVETFIETERWADRPPPE